MAKEQKPDESLFVALLRGVNVGGGNKVPVAPLRMACAALGWSDVRSYIASGNLVFRARPGDLADQLCGVIRSEFGLDVAVLVLPGAQFRAAVRACPFVPVEGKHVHGVFLGSDPDVDWPLFAGLRLPDEELTVEGRVVWLHARNGIGQSKLAEKMPRVLRGATMTARNLNTLRALVAMLDADAAGRGEAP